MFCEEAAMVEEHVSNIFAELGPRPDCHSDLDRRGRDCADRPRRRSSSGSDGVWPESGSACAPALVGNRTSSSVPVDSRKKGRHMIGIIIAILLAALVYWVCLAIGLPAIVAIIAAILVLLSGIGTGGYGYGRRGI
jgi:hypothetical protein